MRFVVGVKSVKSKWRGGLLNWFFEVFFGFGVTVFVHFITYFPIFKLLPAYPAGRPGERCMMGLYVKDGAINKIGATSLRPLASIQN